MSASTLNLPVIEKGATYRHTLTWTDAIGAAINLTGCTAKLQVRTSITSSTVVLELSSVNNRIIITPLTGVIELYISATDTMALSGTGGVYDLEIYFSNGDITRLIEGSVVFKNEVTR
ncbi:hypothetical protein UFOVP1516_67 [uncultured Caudovirales phage]|uniref:BppU N-terminal domain-containing protein n=1 Tax=uncultured Caudovirales phage TaxID=2100421 RepID=A0A6J5PDI5_9CAUD|nr:hypothetical protein UFOVP887_68 [uncultured Caudovirales phage]CAB5226941.1 hypothetical protein UFOVP1516_67 [uncultured Caudovirales phage]